MKKLRKLKETSKKNNLFGISKTSVKGITLIALVITIIVLLILAGIAIGALTGENGIIKNSQKAAEEHGRAKGMEQIQLVLGDDSIERSITKADLTIGRLEEIFKEKEWVSSAEITEENELTIINDEGYIYIITINDEGKIEVEDIGRNTGPIITRINLINTSTNSISIEVGTINVKGDIEYTYLYKKEIESDYIEIETTTDANYTYTELEDNTTYYIKVQIKAKNGTAEKEKDITTGEMPEEAITFTNPKWSNGKASVIINTSVEDYILQYQIGSITGEWTEIENGSTISDLNHGETVYGRLWDGTNETEAASVDVKDEKAPEVSISLGEITSSTAELIVVAIDEETGLVTSETYKYYLNGTEITALTTNSYTYTGLEEGTEQTLSVKVTDKAGNETEKDIVISLVEGEGAIMFSNATWVNGTATITVNTNTNNTIMYQKNSTEGEWKEIENGGKITGLIHGETIYARLYDGTNYGDWASTTIKDTTTPTVSVEILGTPTAGTNGWYKSDVTLKITGSTTGSAIETLTYKLEGDSTGEKTITGKEGTVTITAEGTTTITVYAYNQAGTKSSEETLTVKKDTVAPTVSTVTASDITSNSVKITATATDNIEVVKYEYRRKNNDIANSTTYLLQEISANSRTCGALSDGTNYTFFVRAKDAAGNYSEYKEVKVTTVTIPSGQTTGVITFGDPTWSSGKASVTVSTNKTGYTLQYQKGGTSGTWTTITSGGKVTGLTHNDTVYARLWDGTNAGDWASTTIKDTVAPTVSSITVKSNSITYNGATLIATATDNVGVTSYEFIRCSSSGTVYQRYTSSTNELSISSLTFGNTYYFRVRVKDAAGNWSNDGNPSTQAVTFTTKSYPLASSVLEEGNYVNYVVGDKHETLAGKSIKCVVLYGPNTTYGTQIIARQPTETIEMGIDGNDYISGTYFDTAKESFNNSVETLNIAASKYTDNKLVSASRSVGYGPDFKETSSKLYYSDNYDWLEDYQWDGAFYVGGGTDDDWTKMKELGIWQTGTETAAAPYYFAGRSYNEDGIGVGLGINYVSYQNGAWVKNFANIIYLRNDGTVDTYKRNYGLRPVFKLNTNVYITGGSGTSSSPYTLTYK